MPCTSTQDMNHLIRLLIVIRGHNSVHAIAGSATADDGPHIKTEFVFAAE